MPFDVEIIVNDTLKYGMIVFYCAIISRFARLRQDLMRLLAFRPQESPVFVPVELDMDHFINLVCLVYKGCLEQHVGDGSGYDDTFERLLGYTNTMHHVCVYGTRQLEVPAEVGEANVRDVQPLN